MSDEFVNRRDYLTKKIKLKRKDFIESRIICKLIKIVKHGLLRLLANMKRLNYLANFFMFFFSV